MKLKFLDFGAFLGVVKAVARDMMQNPLRKYVAYSLVFHVVVVGLFSIGMLFPEAPPAPKSKKGEPAKSSTVPAEDSKVPAKPPAATKATGDKGDYYKHQNIDTTPAKPEEIPANPFDVKEKDDMK